MKSRECCIHAMRRLEMLKCKSRDNAGYHYKYVTKLEILETNDPQLEEGTVVWMLGLHTKPLLNRWTSKTKEHLFAKINPLEMIILPKQMYPEAAWPYFDEYIKSRDR